jgi:2-succinyl-5-enolpyruvyl-6-hydroxy-3-cyclohexene-1-carboxylate synthase
MAQQTDFADKATSMWSCQIDRWVESVNLYQKQCETLADLWTNQVAEVQKESQKFMKEWLGTVNKAQADLLKQYQRNLKDAASFFSVEPSM